MYNEIYNVLTSGNIECFFVILGVFEKLGCIYSVWWFFKRYVLNGVFRVGWFDDIEMCLCLKYIGSFINKKCVFFFSDEVVIVFF